VPPCPEPTSDAHTAAGAALSGRPDEIVWVPRLNRHQWRANHSRPSRS
jgi:hypothetical protein